MATSTIVIKIIRYVIRILRAVVISLMAPVAIGLHIIVAVGMTFNAGQGGMRAG